MLFYVIRLQYILAHSSTGSDEAEVPWSIRVCELIRGHIEPQTHGWDLAPSLQATDTYCPDFIIKTQAITVNTELLAHYKHPRAQCASYR